MKLGGKNLPKSSNLSLKVIWLQQTINDLQNFILWDMRFWGQKWSRFLNFNSLLKQSKHSVRP